MVGMIFKIILICLHLLLQPSMSPASIASTFNCQLQLPPPSIASSFNCLQLQLPPASIASSFSWRNNNNKINLNMPYLKIYIHFVWSTKYREPLLDTRSSRELVWKHIKENAGLKGIHIDSINGYEDHCHCLISLGVNQSVNEIMQLVKGESAFWINQNKELFPNLNGRKFGWQESYYASSVSESALNKIRNYIKNQETHHKRKSFDEEIEEIFGCSD
jgi:REP element-mobilizing transposase RayT